GLVAGNFSAYWLGISIVGLMSVAFYVSTMGLDAYVLGTTVKLMLAPAVFAFGLVAFGFLGMGPVTIAVDSYGPGTDSAQRVYELSVIEQARTVDGEMRTAFRIQVRSDRARHPLREADGPGSAFAARRAAYVRGARLVRSRPIFRFLVIDQSNGESRGP